MYMSATVDMMNSSSMGMYIMKYLARNGSCSEKKLVAQKIRVKYLQKWGGDFNSPRF